MKHIKDYTFWFLTGSQDLYGEETLKQVEIHSKEIIEGLNSSNNLACKLIYKDILINSRNIEKTIKEANLDDNCAGVVCWMHTFSPAKMWINGLNALNKPMLQINTQFNKALPYETIDMDFMNLNQSAHGDREFGYITARMNINRSVIVGHWQSPLFQKRMSKWMRAAVAATAGKSLNVVRFGDNMRDVAVTCGDKVEAYIKLGWNIPYFGIGDLVEMMKDVSETEIDNLMEEYQRDYVIAEPTKYNLEHIREQAKIEIALEKFLIENNAEAFCTNFQDLHGMKQLPGLACQHLMAKGYGFAGEGDWKTAAMVRTLKLMGEDLDGGCTFLEDYTYNLEEDNMFNLSAHMLEICPSVAKNKPTIEVHPLGIGDKEDPARLVFNSKTAAGISVSIVDLGTRMRIVSNKAQVIEAEKEFKNLPVARILLKPEPNFITSSECWILSGAGHHNSFSTQIDEETLEYYSEIVNIELIEINNETTVSSFRKQDRWNRAYYG
ncbi:MAG: L-arabinose isomerase [Pleomorphochaeta sp.]